MHVIAHGVYGHRKRVCTESWLWEKNPLPHRGIRTHVSGVTVRCSNQLSYIPTLLRTQGYINPLAADESGCNTFTIASEFDSGGSG